MAEFKDKLGNTWSYDLVFDTARRVKRQSGQDGGPRFDLFEPQKDDLAQRLMWNMEEFWELLWWLAKPKLDEKQITAEKFGELMAEDCLVAANLQFFKEWAGFFHRSSREELAIALQKMLEEKQKAMKKLQSAVATEFQAISETLEQKLDQKLKTEFGKLRDSLASILDS